VHGYPCCISPSLARGTEGLQSTCCRCRWISINASEVLWARIRRPSCISMTGHDMIGDHGSGALVETAAAGGVLIADDYEAAGHGVARGGAAVDDFRARTAHSILRRCVQMPFSKPA